MFNLQVPAQLSVFSSLYQLGHIGCDDDLVKVTIARFPDMDFTVLLVGVVALHRVPVSVAVLTNVVSVHPLDFVIPHSQVSLTVVIFMKFTMISFFM